MLTKQQLFDVVLDAAMVIDSGTMTGTDLDEKSLKCAKHLVSQLFSSLNEIDEKRYNEIFGDLENIDGE